MQKQLDNVFGYSLDADGYFGPKTEAAVMDFQSKHSQCGGVDGIVGPLTWAVLFASNNTPTTPVSPAVNPPVKNPTVPSAQTQSPAQTAQVQTYCLQPDLFWVQGPTGISYGGNQDWWPNGSTQRHYGCGTVAAANILAYLALTHSNLRRLFDYGQNVTQNQFTKYMSEVYQYVHPNYFLWIPGKEAKNDVWCQEVLAFAKSRGVVLKVHAGQTFGSDKSSEFVQLLNAIKAGLNDGCPVAILDIMNPGYSIYSFHWLTITRMDYSSLDDVSIVVSTWGTRKGVDLNDYFNGAWSAWWLSDIYYNYFTW